MSDGRRREQIRKVSVAIEAVVGARQIEQGAMTIPDRESTLAKAEYQLRGVRDSLLEDAGDREATDG